MSSALDTTLVRRRLTGMQPGWVVEHVDGGQGTVCRTRDFGGEVLVEWGDLSRTWEAARDLQALE